MKRLTFVAFLLGGVFLLAGCWDPDESGVPNGRDFKSGDATLSGSNVVTDVHFYDAYAGMEFFYYFDNDRDGVADFLVKRRSGEFVVLKGPGIFNIHKYTGAPTVSGDHYHLEFPLSALELGLDREFNTAYWFFEMQGQDRMPDQKNKLLVYVR